MVFVEFGTPLAVMGDGKRASDIDSVAFGCRHQRTVWNAVGNLESRCPPLKFSVIRRVVETQRFGQLGRLRKLRTQIVGDHVKAYRVGVDNAAQLRLERLPVRGRREREADRCAAPGWRSHGGDDRR